MPAVRTGATLRLRPASVGAVLGAAPARPARGGRASPAEVVLGVAVSRLVLVLFWRLAPGRFRTAGGALCLVAGVIVGLGNRPGPSLWLG